MVAEAGVLAGRMRLSVAGLVVVVAVVPDGLATLSVPLTSLRPPQSLLARLA